VVGEAAGSHGGQEGQRDSEREKEKVREREREKWGDEGRGLGTRYTFQGYTPNNLLPPTMLTS
jgi:hypothetical protein